jgi:hypothetical protein
MIKVYPSAPYHYEVTGTNEKDTAPGQHRAHG